MFEKATRMKLRFDSPKGMLTLEDLWDVPLIHTHCSLDIIAKSINKKVKESEEESFVQENTKASKLLTLKLDIVKHIIAVKLEETEKAAKAKDDREELNKLMLILENKQNEQLSEMSVKDIQKRIKKLSK